MPRHYADNAYNRSIGRVGMTHGTAVVSRSSGGGGSFHSGYASSSSSSYSSNVYVDNSMNRSLGRVGLPHGSAVVSRSSGGSAVSANSSSENCYVDNSMNRGLGRVGLPHGSAVVSRSSGGSSITYNHDTGSTSSTSCYVDNQLNRRLGRVGLERGTAVYSKSQTSTTATSRAYVDNAYNRKLGRVGLAIGSAVVSKSGTTSTASNQSTGQRTYVDNALNRRLKRVGKPLGTMPVSRTNQRPVFDFNQNNCEVPNLDLYEDNIIQEIELLKNLKQARQDKIPDGNKLQLKAEHVISFDDLSLGDIIGGGGFGDVHVALWEGNQVAVKKLRVQRVSQIRKKQFQDEVRSISELDHPYIVKFYGACIVPPNLAIVMEFLPDGSLYDNLYYADSVQFDEHTKNQFIRDTFSALKYLHSKNMVHRDIKSKNVMLFDKRTHCKLADFGLALKDESETNASQRQHGFAGTEKYCPKEVIEGHRLTVEQLKYVDVYSLALTTVELLTELEPFEGLNIYQIRKAIIDGELPRLKGYGISKQKKKLLMKALSVHVEIRPTAASFLNTFDAIESESDVA